MSTMPDKVVHIHIAMPGESERERLLFDSNVFQSMRYEVKNGMLVIYTPKNGVLALPIRSLDIWAAEIWDICETWGDIRT